MIRTAELEVLVHEPATPPIGSPLLFVHGAYAGAWCWEEYFLPWFAQAGYACHALSLSGHGGSPGREYLDSFGIDDFVADVARVADLLPRAPVLIGHSMGGMVVQKYLEHRKAAGAILLSSVPPQGLGASALRLAFKKPNLMADLNSLLAGGVVAPESLREALFAQPVEPERLMRYYVRSQPESFRAIWDMTLFNLPRTRHMNQPPMLVLGAERDHLIPPGMVEITARTYGLNAEIFPDLGHGMMLEQGWRTVAERIHEWLRDIAD